MSTCFTPVAADLRPGDVIIGIGETRFAQPRTVSGVEPLGETLVVTFATATQQAVTVRSADDVALEPPF